LDDYAFDAAVKRHSVTDMKGLIQPDCDTGENVGQRILKRQAKNDRYDARRRQETRDVEVEHGVKDDKYGRRVDRSRGQIGEQSRLA
jgi:hypothetical protein